MLDRLTLVDFILSGVVVWLAFISFNPKDKYPNLTRYAKNIGEKYPRLAECQKQFHANLNAMLKIETPEL